MHPSTTLGMSLAVINPIPYPGIVVGAVHVAIGALGRPPGAPARGRLVAPDGSPGPPKCVFQVIDPNLGLAPSA